MPRILFHVQYLKGLGHLARARLIAEAAVASGLEVDMVSGGLPVDDFAPRGARLHQLPALQAGPGGFRDLRDAEGRVIDDAWKTRRRDALLGLFAAIAPDVLLIEAFPFGRRALGFELLPLLDAARTRQPAPTVLCSIRDILQLETRTDRLAETVARLKRYFDAVLVHGDPEFAALDASFAETGAIRDLVTYTGLVAAPPAAYAADGETPRDDVIVSMGGGAIGPQLLRAALGARRMTRLEDTQWRLLTGPHLPADDMAAILAAASSGIMVERFRDDFRRLLGSARLSISYAGYNTSLDVLRSGVRAVLVTYSGGGGETEQTRRAGRMAELGLASVVPDRELTAERLAKAIEVALDLKPAPTGFDLDGARATAEILGRSVRAPGAA